jgi:hypothetical protein
MAGLKDYTGIIIAILVAVVVVYLIDPTFFGLMKSVSGFKGSRSVKSGFEDMMKEKKEDKPTVPMAGGDANVGMNTAGEAQREANVTQEHVAPAVPSEGFSDMAGAADFESTPAPAGCYAREQINPGELLPKESGVWAEQNPSGPGSLKGKNFLSAGALIGVNTIGQSLKNASWDLRSEPACPQVPVSIFNNSTYQPDLLRRPLEIQ